MKKYKLSDVLKARTNDKILKDCSSELRRLFDGCPEEELMSESSNGRGDWSKDWCRGYEYFVYRIPNNWPPAEQIEDDTQPKAPEGYRIVSMEDRMRCEYPEDCDVKYWIDPRWLRSKTSSCWIDKDQTFVVPEYYVFAEDRKRENKYNFQHVEINTMNGEPLGSDELREFILEFTKTISKAKEILEMLNKRIAENEAILAAFEKAQKGEWK